VKLVKTWHSIMVRCAITLCKNNPNGLTNDPKKHHCFPSTQFCFSFFWYGQSSYFGTNALDKCLSKWPNVLKYFEIFGLLWQMNSQWWFWTQKISDLDMFNTCFWAKHSFLRVIFGVALHPVLWDNQPFTTTAHRCSFFPPFSVLPHKASVESVSYFASTVHVT